MTRTRSQSEESSRPSARQVVAVAVGAGLMLFLLGVFLAPVLYGEPIRRDAVVYWAVAAPIGGVIAAVLFYVIERTRRKPRKAGPPPTTRRIVFRNTAAAVPAAAAITLSLIVRPWEVSPSELVWWRILVWIVIFLALTAAIGVPGVIRELAPRWTGRRGPDLK